MLLANCLAPRICNFVDSLFPGCVRLLNHIYLTLTTLYRLKIPLLLIKLKKVKIKERRTG